jgi:LacI family transcriptional regulator
MATIKDVAREAGVSVATVSRVLNSSGPVRAAVADRIRRISAQLRYVPHSGARSLITARTNTLGVLLPDLYGEFFSELIRGMDRAAQSRGYHLLLSSAHGRAPDIASLMHAMRGRVDGMILMSPRLDPGTLFENLPGNVPAVLLSSDIRDDRYPVVTIDNMAGAHAMVRHLLALGHRRIAHIAGEPGNHDAEARRRGYRKALGSVARARYADLEIDGDFTEASGYAATQALLSLRTPPTAIFAANDAMAIGALSALREAGRRVPADLSVAGFDDVPLAQYLNPPLTSVHVPIDEMGARAAHRLIAAIAGDAVPRRRHERLPTQLVVRASCGKPPKHSRTHTRRSTT